MDFDNNAITENTRASYPIDYIEVRGALLGEHTPAGCSCRILGSTGAAAGLRGALHAAEQCRPGALLFWPPLSALCSCFGQAATPALPLYCGAQDRRAHSGPLCPFPPCRTPRSRAWAATPRTSSCEPAACFNLALQFTYHGFHFPFSVCIASARHVLCPLLLPIAQHRAAQRGTAGGPASQPSFCYCRLWSVGLAMHLLTCCCPCLPALLQALLRRLWRAAAREQADQGAGHVLLHLG